MTMRKLLSKFTALMAATAFGLLVGTAAIAANDRPSATPGTGGSAKLRADPGIPCPEGKVWDQLDAAKGCRGPYLNCPNATVNWTAGGYVCTGDIAANAHRAEAVRVSGNVFPGQASFRCWDGSWLQDNAVTPSCVPRTCAAQTVSWNGSAACSAYVGALGHDQVSGTVNASNGNLGSAQFKCNNGNLEVQGGSTCNPPPKNCNAQTVSWSQGGYTCSGYAPSTSHMSMAASITSSNGNPGSGNFLCNDGTFIQQGGSSCAAPPPRDCASQTLTWSVGGVNCRGTVPATLSGNSGKVFSDASSTEGAAEFLCTDGTFSNSPNTSPTPSCKSTVCTGGSTWVSAASECRCVGPKSMWDGANCTCPSGKVFDGTSCVDPASDCAAGQVRNWSVNGNTCSGVVSFAPHGGSGTASNSTPGMTGSANFVCNNGNFSAGNQGGATCEPKRCQETVSQAWSSKQNGDLWGSGRCMVSQYVDIASGDGITLNSSTTTRGELRYTCNKGTLTPDKDNRTCNDSAPQNCTPISPVAGPTQTWSGGWKCRNGLCNISVMNALRIPMGADPELKLTVSDMLNNNCTKVPSVPETSYSGSRGNYQWSCTVSWQDDIPIYGMMGYGEIKGAPSSCQTGYKDNGSGMCIPNTCNATPPPPPPAAPTIVARQNVPWAYYSYLSGRDLYVNGGQMRVWSDDASATTIDFSLYADNVTEGDYGSRDRWNPGPNYDLLPDQERVRLPLSISSNTVLPITKTIVLAGSGCSGSNCTYTFFRPDPISNDATMACPSGGLVQITENCWDGSCDDPTKRVVYGNVRADYETSVDSGSPLSNYNDFKCVGNSVPAVIRNICNQHGCNETRSCGNGGDIMVGDRCYFYNGQKARIVGAGYKTTYSVFSFTKPQNR